MSKIKEVTMDFRKKPPLRLPAAIYGLAVEIVQQYKCMGPIFDDKLTLDKC